MRPRLRAFRDERGRVIGDEDRKRVMPGRAMVRPAFLVDGFVGGTWRMEHTRRKASLVIEPFGTLAKEDRDALAEEGGRLLAFVAAGAEAARVASASTRASSLGREGIAWPLSSSTTRSALFANPLCASAGAAQFSAHTT